MLILFEENQFDFEDESLKAYWSAFLEEIESRNDNDYEINKEQAAKLLVVWQFFNNLASKSEYNSIQPINLTPKFTVGDVVADFIAISISGKEVLQFAKAISYASSVGFDVMDDDRIHVEITIPKVFVLKKS